MRTPAFAGRLAPTFKKCVVTAGVIAALLALLGCTSNIPLVGEKGSNGAGPLAKVNDSGIVRFFYSYSGTVGGNDYTYRVELDDEGEATFTYDSLEYRDYGMLSCPVDQDVIDGLQAIYEECKLARWDGYDKYNPHVLDGSGFYLSISFADGKTMDASGSNCFPQGYGDFETKMKALLDPYAEKVRKQHRAEVVKAGISGTLESAMISFTQCGKSGSNDYSFFIVAPGVRDKNFDAKISSDGEFFPEGTHRYFAALPADAIGFDDIQKLIEKHNVITWYGWDETAQDYPNAEWFQLSFSFSDGLNLDAMGTEHPENYDAFRADLLQLLSDVVAKAEREYGLTEYKK